MKLVGRKGCLKMTTRLDENLDLKMCYKCGTEYFKDWPRCPNCMAENNSTMDKCVLFKGIGKKIIAISLVLHCLFFIPIIGIFLSLPTMFILLLNP